MRIKNNNSFDKGHKPWNKGLKMTEEYCRTISNNLKGRKLTAEHCEKLKGHKPWSTGKKMTPEFCEKVSEGLRGQKPWNLGKRMTSEFCEAISSSLKGRKLTIKHRKAVSDGGKGKKLSKMHCKAISEGNKKKWLNPEYVAKVQKGLQLKPNKPETIILDILNDKYPGEWKFTGDFSFVINGKNPDFVNCNGQKKVIDLFGDYWHKGEKANDRKKVFKPFGYDSLIIWEKELRDMKKVTNRITKFCEK